MVDGGPLVREAAIVAEAEEAGGEAQVRVIFLVGMDWKIKERFNSIAAKPFLLCFVYLPRNSSVPKN